MKSQTITPDLIVEEVLNKWPETVPVFLRYRMGCVGCTMAPFETLSSAVEIHRLPLNRFLRELQEAVEQ
jgi:hybrid cluster-associated redox disulfide protein